MIHLIPVFATFFFSSQRSDLEAHYFETLEEHLQEFGRYIKPFRTGVFEGLRRRGIPIRPSGITDTMLHNESTP